MKQTENARNSNYHSHLATMLPRQPVRRAKLKIKISKQTNKDTQKQKMKTLIHNRFPTSPNFLNPLTYLSHQHHY